MPLPTRAHAFHHIGIPGLVVKGPDGTFWGYPLAKYEEQKWIDYEENRITVCRLCRQAVALVETSRLPIGCYAAPGCAVAEAERVRRHG